MANINEDVYKEILNKLKELSYGSLLITVHNSEVTQLDVTQKKRFNQVQTAQQSVKTS